MKLVVTLALIGSACSDRDRPRPSETLDRTPRVLEPPPLNVRALPPHAIRADGVGPFKLGLTLEQLGSQVLSGGRSAQVDIPNVTHLSVLHAEDDAIQVGGEPLGRASFVAVVRPKIARTESGIQVGSTRDELLSALGQFASELDRVRDPRVLVPTRMRELRAVIDHDLVVGLVIATSEPAVKIEGCVRPAETEKRFGACLTGEPELVAFDNDELQVRSADDKKLVDRAKLANAVFVGPVRTSDGRDELVAITRTEDPQVRTWSLVTFRFEGGHLLRMPDVPVYQLTAANARWIGSSLRDLDLELEVSSHGDVYEVGGLLTHRMGNQLRDLLVLSPVQVPRRRAKSATPDPEHEQPTARVPFDAPSPMNGSGENRNSP
ncbi:hypothetical protein BH11MYX1_BH11MYX1_06370 [soil metagenome]